MKTLDKALEYLVCPVDNFDMGRQGSRYVCRGCGSEYPIIDGTPSFSIRPSESAADEGALKNMILPSALVVLFPIVIGVLLKAEAVAAFLMVGTITGVLMALFFNNSGGALDNAKKLIEINDKGSESYKAAVVGDTVGDSEKDVCGPSLHVVIKLLAILALVLAPLFI